MAAVGLESAALRSFTAPLTSAIGPARAAPNGSREILGDVTNGLLRDFDKSLPNCSAALAVSTPAWSSLAFRFCASNKLPS